ncbi:hypothetical protein [Rhodoferax sp.]|uniref:hypothetical protein n=1 Tax=Rhodoferax sp. TaxID=50421 RepID=UPI00374D819F
MGTTTLAPTAIALRVNALFDRLLMLQELTRLTIEKLPDSTDSNVPMALLNGMQEMLRVDAADAYELGEAVAQMAVSGEHLHTVEV